MACSIDKQGRNKHTKTVYLRFFIFVIAIIIRSKTPKEIFKINGAENWGEILACISRLTHARRLLNKFNDRFRRRINIDVLLTLKPTQYLSIDCLWG